MRRLWLVLLCAACVAAPVATASAATEDRGIVIRVLPPRFAIRELDGSRVGFRINRSTVITLNGRRVRLWRLHAGDVVAVEHFGRFVTEIRAFRS